MNKKIIMEEIWKPAIYIYPDGRRIDFSDIYEVSNLGRIKHLPKIRIKNGFEHHYSTKISDYSEQGGRYCDTHFVKDGKKYKIQIHRLVLSSFKPVSDTYECVNHKDYNTHNNNLENIEWCTTTFNNNYGNRNEKLSISNMGIYNKGGSKTTLQYDLDGNFLKEWPSAAEAARFYNVKRTSIINCCLGKVKTSCGFIWKYKKNGTNCFS